MKAITFLGAGRAFETTYVLPDGRDHTAPFFGVALARFYPDLDMQVFVTQQARSKHLADFLELAEDYVGTLEPIDIPDGANEEELWTVFQTVIDGVDEGEEVVFDITHGFRSLPFLSFLAAAYLRVIKKVKLKAVFYGNFEARDVSVEPNRAPVIDLTPFISLLDWMVAADRFNRFGDGRDLVDLMQAKRPDYQDDQDQFQAWYRSGIGQAMTNLQDLSLAMRFIRPQEAMPAAEKLGKRMAKATEGIQSFARPLQPLAQQIVEGYAPLAMAKDEAVRDPTGALAVERAMVHWYLERNQAVQAVALAREWIVSWAMLHLGATATNDRAERDPVERGFGIGTQRQRGKELESTPVYAQLIDLPNIETAFTLYAQLGDLRNDLLHAGKRASARTSETLARDVPKLCRQIDDLEMPDRLDGV